MKYESANLIQTTLDQYCLCQKPPLVYSRLSICSYLALVAIAPICFGLVERPCPSC